MSVVAVWGYAYTGTFVEVGSSEVGAKRAATHYGSVEVGYRSSINNMFIPTAKKIKGKWTKVQN